MRVATKAPLGFRDPLCTFNAKVEATVRGDRGTAEFDLPDDEVFPVHEPVAVGIAVLQRGISVVQTEALLPDEEVAAIHGTVAVEVGLQGDIELGVHLVRKDEGLPFGKRQRSLRFDLDGIPLEP